MFGYENLTLEQLYLEKNRVNSSWCENQSQEDRKATKLAELAWLIAECGGIIKMSEYKVEFICVVQVEAENPKDLMQKLKVRVFSNTDVEIESLCVVKEDPYYKAEFVGMLVVEAVGIKDILQRLKTGVFTNPDIDIESLCIEKL